MMPVVVSATFVGACCRSLHLYQLAKQLAKGVSAPAAVKHAPVERLVARWLENPAAYAPGTQKPRRMPPPAWRAREWVASEALAACVGDPRAHLQSYPVDGDPKSLL